jgi:glutamine synthetase type III
MKSEYQKDIKRTIEELKEICSKIEYGQQVIAELYLEQDLSKVNDFLASQEILLSAASSAKERLYQILEGKTVTEFLSEKGEEIDPEIRKGLKDHRHVFLGISQANLTNQRFFHSSISHGQAILQAIFANSSQYTPHGRMKTGYETPGRTPGMSNERYL